MKPISTFYKSITFRFNKQLFYSYISILIIALLLFSCVIYFGTVSMLKGRMLASSAETVEQAAINMQQYMDDVETLMFNISMNSSIQELLSSKKTKSDLKVVLEVQEIVDQLLSVDVFSKKTEGVYLFADYQSSYPVYRPDYLRPESGLVGKNAVFRAEEIRMEQWYQDAIKARGRVVWSIPDEGTPHSGTMIFASRMIINTKNTREPLGVIRVSVPISRFQKNLEEISFGAAGTAYLYADGTLLNSDEEEKAQKIESIVQENGEAIMRCPIGTEQCYVIISDTRIENWKLVGIIPEKTMLSQFKFAESVILPSLLIAFLLALILTRVLSKNLSEPIHQVAEAMQNYDINHAKRFREDRTGEIGVLFCSFNRMMNHIDSLLEEIQETSTKQRRAELRALQAQINPHFLYNTLDCIKSIACLNENKEIVELTTAFCEFFRISLNKGEEEIPLYKEILHVQNYCAIQKYRSSVNFRFETDIEERLMSRIVIKLILQPLVENSILHGFLGARRDGLIRITAREWEEFLILSVMDNGIGTDTEYLNGVVAGEYKVSGGEDFHSGYGIVNVDERLKLAFGKNSGLRFIENEEDGITVEVWMEQRAIGDCGFGKNRE